MTPRDADCIVKCQVVQFSDATNISKAVKNVAVFCAAKNPSYEYT